MKAHIVRTDEIYRSIIHAPDEETRKAIYREKLVQPWQQMMAMVAGAFAGGDAPQDEFAGARAWAWYLPDQLSEAPAVLEALEAANAWDVLTDGLQAGVDALAPFADQIPFDSVEGWLLLADPERSDPVMKGYTGAIDFMQPRFVLQYDTTTERNLAALSGAAVHEFNHLVRLKAFPWGMDTSVADYIIHEGIAESFAQSLFGDAVLGYYVTDFDESQLATAKNLIADGLDKTGFDIIRSYIFGDHLAEKLGLPITGMPEYGGYAIGYRVVQAYLKRTGKSAAEATFASAEEIVRESEYFS